MTSGTLARRALGPVLVLVVAAAALLGARAAQPGQGLGCIHGHADLLPQYAADVPGPATAEAATLHLVASLDATVALGASPTDLDVTEVERRGSTAVVEVADEAGLQAVVLVRTHPAGGWMVDQLRTCAGGRP